MSTDKFIYLLLFSLLNIIFVSCSDNVIIDKEIDISKSGWTYEDTLVYDFIIDDTSKSVDFLLDVNYNIGFGYKNLYTEVSTIFPNGLTTKEVLSLELRSADALEQTKCNGNNCKVPIVMLEGASFSQKGRHLIKINQLSRVDTLQGIESIRLSIVKN